QRAIDRKALLNVDQDEGGDREVERVDDPAEKDGPEGAPLIARDLRVPRHLRRLDDDGFASGHVGRQTTTSLSLEAPSFKLQTADCELEARSWKPGAGNWKLEAASRELKSDE